MGIHRGPNIIRDGLVYGYDTGNTITSPAGLINAHRYYKGEPTTNLAGNLTPTFGNWSGLTGLTEYYTTSNNRQGVKLVTNSSGGVQWYSVPLIGGILPNTTYTVSAKVKHIDGGSPNANLFYIRQYANGSQTSEGGRFISSYAHDLGDGWKRAYRTFTTDSTANQINLQGYEYSSGRIIYIEDIQLEQKGHATAYAGANTVRGVNNSIIDLVNNTTTSVANVSFTSTGQLEFDGTDDYISIGASSKFNITRYMTVEAVVKKDIANQWNGIFGPRDGNGPCHFQMNYNNIGVYLYGPNLPITAYGVIPDYDFYHVTLTYDGSTANIYVNGTVAATASTTSTANLTGTSDFNIGRVYSSARYFNGQIPTLKLYNRALSAQEVTNNYTAYKSRFNI
mgnify:CR=1 FL=1